MTWYRTGTIAIANGSTAVVGTGTTFDDTAAGVNVGDALIVGTGTSLRMYEIASVNNATSLTLATPATIAAAAGSAYQIQTSVALTNQSLGKKVAAAMDRILAGISNWMLIFKGSGDVTITNYDGSTSTGKAWPTLSSLVSNAIQKDGTVAMTGSLTAPGIELVADIPCVDFHYGKSTLDFTSRLVEWGVGRLEFKADASGYSSGYGYLRLGSVRAFGGVFGACLADGSQLFDWSVNSANNLVLARNGSGSVDYNGTAIVNVGNFTSSGTITAAAVKSNTALSSVTGVFAGGAGVPLNVQGTYLSWNETPGTGRSSIINNRGGGVGGLDVRIINVDNTAQIAGFSFEPNGTFRAPFGSYSVNGRVRLASGVQSNYIEIQVDGSTKGINFFDSDRTLKEKIEDADEDKSIQIIRAMHPVSYKFKDRRYTFMSPDPATGLDVEVEGVMAGASYDYGVIAQEFEELMPCGVITNTDGLKSLDPLANIGLLLSVCHTQQKMIDDLSSRVSDMEGKTTQA